MTQLQTEIAANPEREPQAALASSTEIAWETVIPLGLMHVLGFALAPFYFSWTGLAVALVGAYVIAPLGVNLTYHRALAHRSLRLPRWLERSLVVVGVWSFQGPPIPWVTIHRLHHRHSDEERDPHNATRGFYWSHMGWITRPPYRPWPSATFARDLAADPFYVWLDAGWHWFSIYLAHVLLLIGGSVMLSHWAGYTWAQAFELGMSVLVWGVLIRHIYTWHITWCINSVTHLWGYRSYESNDLSRNNWVLGLLGGGEGWHNNHHHDPASASNWHKAWEFDLTYVFIRCLEGCGLAHGVKRPRSQRRATLHAGD